MSEEGRNLLSSSATVDYQPEINQEDLIDGVSKYHALIVRGRTQISKAVLDAASNLKVIGRAGVGVDNIDLASAQSKEVIVVNTPTSTTVAVVEHTLALMLALVRKIPRADSTMKQGQWQKNELVGTELGGKTLGIIGLGAIGSGVAPRAKAFRMTVIAYDPYLTDDEVRRRDATSVTLTELFTRSDFISLHPTLTPESRDMIDGQAIASMKRGVNIICAARGNMIDETALLGGLESGQIAGAALDVYADEPPGLTALVSHPNVIATPHIGAQTVEAQNRASRDIAKVVLQALKGHPLQWRVV
jgi:D-3-phosphoglycerate dehydrogenase